MRAVLLMVVKVQTHVPHNGTVDGQLLCAGGLRDAQLHNEEYVYPKRAKLAVGEEASSSGGFASSSSEATDSEA